MIGTCRYDGKYTSDLLTSCLWMEADERDDEDEDENTPWPC